MLRQAIDHLLLYPQIYHHISHVLRPSLCLSFCVICVSLLGATAFIMAKTYTAYNIRIILVLTLGSLTFGYAYSVISNTLGQPGFITYFGLDGPDQSYANAITGAINGMFSAGGVFGALLAGWMCEARGRKETMNLAALITIIGAAIQTGSVNITMFLAARFITGWGIGMMVVLIPLYQAEICKS